MDQNHYAATSAPLIEQHGLGVRWGRALAVWWSAAWRGFLYSFLAGFVFGAVAAAIGRRMGMAAEAQVYGVMATYAVSIPLSMLAMKQALSKHVASLVAEYAALPPNTSLERTRDR